MANTKFCDLKTDKIICLKLKEHPYGINIIQGYLLPWK